MTALQWVILSVILIVGIVLRLPLLSAGIGQDDCVTIYVAKAETFAELINRISLYEFNPPLYHLLMQQWLRMVGSAPDIVTGVSLFFGVLLIPLSFAFSRMFFEDNQKALLVAFFAAVSPISVFFSHEVRAYTLFACLAVCLWMAFFASLRKFSISRLAALFVVATLCLYTHYSSIIVIGLIGVFCIIQLLVREDEDGRKILGIMSALALSGLAFSFWLPHFLRHSSFGSFWVDPTPLRDFPFVVASNLAAIMPLPWLPALLIVSLALPLFLVLLLVRARKAKGVSFQSLKRQLRAKRELVFVLFNLITAACAFGYITPFIIGYTRYMVPFAAIGWIVCCMSVLSALPLMSRTPQKASWIIGLVACLGLVSLNYGEVVHLGEGGRSGLKRFAADLTAGKFGPCAVLMAPDYDSYTLIYYLDNNHRKPPANYYTFPNQGMFTPNPPDGYAATWRDQSIIAKGIEWIESLDSQKCQTLVVVRDLVVLDSVQMPAKTRIDQLIERIKKSYRLKSQELYATSGKSFEVFSFQLNP